MSQTPGQPQNLSSDHPYAQAAAQLNRLIRDGHSFSGYERNCCFLNLRGATFANASAVSGIDFAEDGRAVAQADWDFDGDLDLWIANRTAPQLRFMRNELPRGSNHFLAVRLVGTKSNRDAIGARVELTCDDATLLQRSVRAGEGYLAQSSKWLHFGMGERTSIKHLQVNWPNGAREQFSLPENVDAFYRLVEGSGTPVRWTPPSTSPAELNDRSEPFPEPLATHNRLTSPITLPPLRFLSFDGTSNDATMTAGKPRVINLWATWCESCETELASWNKRAADFQSRGIDVVAISVDAVQVDAVQVDAGQVDAAQTSDRSGIAGSNHDSEIDRVKAWANRLQSSFTLGLATVELLDSLQMVHDVVYDHFRPLPVPTTLLLDGDGCLAALYKGTVDVERILNDATLLAQEGDERMANSLPFAGQWIAKPNPLRASRIAIKLWDAGHDEIAKEFTRRLDSRDLENERALAEYFQFERLKAAGDYSSAVAVLQSRLAEHPQDAESYFRLGTLLLQQNQFPQATNLFLQAVRHSKKPRADIHANLGATLRRLGKSQEAEQQLLRSIELDATTTEAHTNLGLIYAGRNRFAEAESHFRRATELDPANVNHQVNLALALTNTKRSSEAETLLREVLSRTPESIVARIYLADALGESGKYRDSLEQFGLVVKAKPDAAKIWLKMAQINEKLHDSRNALACFEKVDELNPNDLRVINRIAWHLSTSPHKELRNGPRALKLAQMAAEKTKRAVPDVLDTLAAAYAETQQFDEAVRTVREAQKTLDVESPDDRHDLRAGLDERLRTYEKKRAFREH